MRGEAAWRRTVDESEEARGSKLSEGERRDLQQRMDTAKSIAVSVSKLLKRRAPLEDEIRRRRYRWRKGRLWGGAAAGSILLASGASIDGFGWLTGAGGVFLTVSLADAIRAEIEHHHAKRKREEIDWRLWDLGTRFSVIGGHRADLTILLGIYDAQKGEIDWDSPLYQNWYTRTYRAMRRKVCFEETRREAPSLTVVRGGRR